MNDRFIDDQNLSRIPSDDLNRGPDLRPRQREIHRHLGTIGPEIAAYYLDGIKILHSTHLETAASLLAHIAREIDGGLRDILSPEETKDKIEKPIQEQLTKEVLEKLGDYEELKKRKGHIASILAALNIDDVEILFSSDDNRTRLAIKWLNVATQFHKFVHRHGAWKSPRSRDEFEELWHEFEDILADLVGTALELLNRIDRLLEYKEPTEEIRETLHNLLEAETRRRYFFEKLESPVWLKPLKEDGWFNPERNPRMQEDQEQPGHFYQPIWYAIEYVAKVSSHPETDISALVNIVNAIIDDTNRSELKNDRTALETIKIIGTFPPDKIELQHIHFMGVALRSEGKYGLADAKIYQTILPKLLENRAEALTLELLKISLEARYIEGQIHSTMYEHSLAIMLKEHWQSIANLCGLKASQIALTQIRKLASENSSLFHFIEPHENDLLQLARADYAELIVGFTSSIFQAADPVSITETLQDLLKKPYVIMKRIAVKAISDHYGSLKHLFWEWESNPLDEVGLNSVMSHLIQTNSNTFSESELERILQWIESTQY